MILKVEAVIDIDSRRRAVIAGEVDITGIEQFKTAAHALTHEVATQALTAAAVAAQELPVERDGAAIAASAGAEPLAPSQRRPRPEDKDSMRTFGKED